ncbi:hypothetical protein ACQKFM_15165 [Paenibacillus xylanexedens]
MSDKEKEPRMIFIQGSVEKRSARLSHPENQPKNVQPSSSNNSEGEKK